MHFIFIPSYFRSTFYTSLHPHFCASLKWKHDVEFPPSPTTGQVNHTEFNFSISFLRGTKRPLTSCLPLACWNSSPLHWYSWQAQRESRCRRQINTKGLLSALLRGAAYVPASKRNRDSRQNPSRQPEKGLRKVLLPLPLLPWVPWGKALNKSTEEKRVWSSCLMVAEFRGAVGILWTFSSTKALPSKGFALHASTTENAMVATLSSPSKQLFVPGISKCRQV